MIFTKQQVFEACKAIAPALSFDPSLIFAVCQQESDKTSSGDFDPGTARLEQGFYRRYIKKMNFATSTEVLLSASYGVMQMMGESLREVGFIDWYFLQCDEEMKALLHHPMSQFAVPSALDAYDVNLAWMIEWGCKWMKMKRDAVNGDIERMLLLWNGGGNPNYAKEVLARIPD